MRAAVLISIGGVIGTLTRYYVGTAIAYRLPLSFPWATLTINVTGCFVLGLVGTLALERFTPFTAEVRLLVGVGFCGAYTTFSTFGLESLALLRAGAIGTAAAYGLASYALGLLATYAGFALARSVP